MNDKPKIPSDVMTLAARLEALEAENARLRRAKSELSISWIQGKEGKALSLTWPGKRSRYLEVTEFRDLVRKSDEVEQFIKGVARQTTAHE
jgi:hypothetical protein